MEFTIKRNISGKEVEVKLTKSELAKMSKAMGFDKEITLDELKCENREAIWKTAK